MFRIRKKHNRRGFTMAELLVVVALISTLTATSIPALREQMQIAGVDPDVMAAAAQAQAVAAGPEVAGLVDAHVSNTGVGGVVGYGDGTVSNTYNDPAVGGVVGYNADDPDDEDWRQYYDALDDEHAAGPDAPDPDAPDPDDPSGAPASAGSDDATPDGGFPDADDTGLVSNGLKILVYPSGAGKVTYSDGRYTAVPNEGYGFMAWYYEPRDYGDNMIRAALQWMRHNQDAAAANRAPLDDESIQERTGYKYLVAIFERGFIPDPEPDADGQDDSTPDGGFPDADDTGLVSNGLKILVYPSGAGKVTYSDGRYTAVPNEGYGFMAWYYEPRDYGDNMIRAALQWMRHNQDAAAANRAPLDDESIQERTGYKYLVAIFERGFTPTIAQSDPSTPAHTHSWGPTTYKWSKNYKKCTAMSTCQTCGAVDKVKADKVTKTKKAATCTKAGKITYKAVFKKKKLKYKTVKIPALGHDWGDWVENGSVKTRTCKRCKATETKDLPKPPHEHTPADAVRENEKAATCQAAGSYDSVVYCATCKAELSRETVATEKLAHTEVEIPAVAATCTEGGKTVGVKCSVCGTILTPQQDTDPLGHTGGTATCKAKAVCTRCKQPYGDYGAHQYELVKPAHAADCENPGSTDLYRCSVCDEAEKGGEYIAPLGHQYVDGFCKRCGKKEPGIVEEEEPMTEP